MSKVNVILKQTPDITLEVNEVAAQVSAGVLVLKDGRGDSNIVAAFPLDSLLAMVVEDYRT